MISKKRDGFLNCFMGFLWRSDFLYFHVGSWEFDVTHLRYLQVFYKYSLTHPIIWLLERLENGRGVVVVVKMYVCFKCGEINFTCLVIY